MPFKGALSLSARQKKGLKYSKKYYYIVICTIRFGEGFSLREQVSPIGESSAFLELQERTSRIAGIDRPVLVVGERGTGKELIAARLHFLSPRWEGPFVKINCAAIAENLIESELFGHEAGAFTGAERRRIGRFEMANGGTLFLDEIGDASLAVQEKILRIIEYGEMERVGSSRTLDVDVRVIGATNKDLPQEAAKQRFRADLLDRLAFDVVTLPPLRARQGDVPLLAGHFGRAMAHELGWEAFSGFSSDALAAMDNYDWPGNVRQLRNVVERAIAAGNGPEVSLSDVLFDPFDSPYRPSSAFEEAPGQEPALLSPTKSGEMPSGASPLDLRAELAALEKRLLEEAMAANRHNQRETAKHLGLSYDQLRNALKKHQLIGG